MRHSRSQVDRAGRVLAEFATAALVNVDDALERISPADIHDARDIVEWWRGTHAQPLSRVAANLRYYASKHGKPVVGQRLKKLPTIAHKLLREPTMKLSRMGDIGGVRAVLPDQDAVYRVAAELRKNWTIARARDYVANPKSDGYRALHLNNRHRGRLIEVQLRTPSQDLWANAVETDARRFDLELKSGGGPEALSGFYAALGELFAILDEGAVPDSALLARIEHLRVRADTFRKGGRKRR